MVCNRWWLVVVVLLATGWSPPSYGQKIRFAQVTDVHVFDSEGKFDKQGVLADSRGENERGLRWAIDEINRRNAAGPGYDFVVFTGDFGLEKPAKDYPNELDRELDRAAEQFAAFLERSDVRTWLMVPGNNDLVEENPGTIDNFHTFIAKLQGKLGSKKSIRDFAPQGTPKANGVYSIANCHFFGFDNASFKSNGTDADKSKFKPDHEECLKRLNANIDESLNAWKKPSAFFDYVFCHIPDIDDPHRKDPAWLVEDSIRGFWEQIVKAPHVKRVFAGHLHAPDRSMYLNLDWARNSKIKRPDENMNKLLVCPPIAVKYQMNQPEEARGFREVLVDTQTGDVESKIVWLNEVPPLATSHDVENHLAREPAARVKSTQQVGRITILIIVLMVVSGAVIRAARNAQAAGKASDMRDAIYLIGLICGLAAALGLVGLLVLA